MFALSAQIIGGQAGRAGQGVEVADVGRGWAGGGGSRGGQGVDAAGVGRGWMQQGWVGSGGSRSWNERR